MDSLRGGLSHRESLEVCVWGVRVRLSQRESLAVSSGVCRGRGSAVTQGVVGGVIF